MTPPAPPGGERVRRSMVSGSPAVFLDRDGVLDKLVPDPASGAWESPLKVEDVRLVARAAEAARALAAAGFALVCVSNQPAAAKGAVTVEQLRAVHARVTELLAQADVHLEASRLCLHHPHGIVPEALPGHVLVASRLPGCCWTRPAR